MKGLILLISAILFSLMLGASSGVAAGSFVSSDRGIDFISGISSRQNQQSSSKPSTKSADGASNEVVQTIPQGNDRSAPTFSGETRTTPSRQIRKAQGDNAFRAETRSLAEAQTQVRVDAARPRSLLVIGGSVVQVSNQVPSSLIVGTCGDSNADGVFDVGDAVTSLQLAVGLEQPTRFHEVFSDFNDDGFLNILDTIKALQHLISQDPIPNDCGPFADQ